MPTFFLSHSLRKIVSFLILFCLAFETSAIERKIFLNLWEKEECSSHQLCLPKPLSHSFEINLSEPDYQSFSRQMIKINEFDIILTLTKRTEENGYYSFHTEIRKSNSQETLIVCSRYEATETMEDSIVGACGGRAPGRKGLIGISTTLAPLATH